LIQELVRWKDSKEAHIVISAVRPEIVSLEWLPACIIAFILWHELSISMHIYGMFNPSWMRHGVASLNPSKSTLGI
jgi:hypothetical protein